MEAQVILSPDWFQGEIYEKGDVVTNPFSGQEYYLNNLGKFIPNSEDET
jgi:hypothetical protein